MLIAPDGTPAEGRSATAARLAELLDRRELRIKISPLASGVDGALDCVTGTYVLWSRDQRVSSGSYAEVWTRPGGAWRIAVDAIVRLV